MRQAPRQYGDRELRHRDPRLTVASGQPLDGTWLIVRTSLDFWRTRTDPAITYATLPDGRMADMVSFRRGEKPGLVAGIDRPMGNGKWEWRGLEPATFLLRSRWQVITREADWAITHFEKTLFTAEGVDIYWRTPLPDPARLGEAVEHLTHHDDTARFVGSLFAPTHTATP